MVNYIFNTVQNQTFVEKIYTELHNLSLSESTDTNTISELIKTNSTLVSLNKNLKYQLQSLKKTRSKNTQQWDPNVYFWSHGYKVGKTNNSQTFQSKDPRTPRLR